MSYQMHFLFVSDRPSWKSHIAAALLNHEDGKHFRGYTATLSADMTIEPEVVDAMREIGIDLSASRPPEVPLESPPPIDRVIVLGPFADVLPWDVPVHERWTLPETTPLQLEAIRAVRDQIHRKIRQLVRTA